MSEAPEIQENTPPPSPRSARSYAREFALQGLYQWRVGRADEAAVLTYLPELELEDSDLVDFARADRELCFALIHGVISQEENLSALVAPYIDRPFVELSPVETCILLLGTHELLAYPQTPYRVVLNEMIELAKIFGGTDGHKYINGVLDRLVASLRPDEAKPRKTRAESA